MKRILIALLVLCILLPALCSCSNEVGDTSVTIVTTVFPEYDWVVNILGHTDGVEVVLLTENGTDLHSFQPTVSDIAKISSCDILICTGGISDLWINDALAATPNQDRKVIQLMSLLSEEEKLVEQSLHHNTQSEHHDHDEHHNEGHGEYDEHVWLSLSYAVRFCEEITNALCQKLPENAKQYTENCEAYVAELNALDTAYTNAISKADVKTLVFADRFPFSYLTHGYGLDCYAAFPGCSAETEASFETVAFLADALNHHSLPSVIVLENADTKLAKTVINTAKRQDVSIISMDSMQSVSLADIESGTSYVDIMKHNLEALCKALNVNEE